MDLHLILYTTTPDVIFGDEQQGNEILFKH